jgi:GntR family transcriptional regulator / MocR family aminotransferase
MDLPLILSRDKKILLRERLGSSLMDAIDQGRLSAGAPLPSSRELAASLGISRPTVVRAYEDLVRIGYLETRPGGKTYVASRHPGQESISNRANVLEVEATNHGLAVVGRRLAAIDLCRGAAADQPLLNFGAPPHWALPLHDWKQILRRNCAALDPAQFELSPHPFGHLLLRDVTADYLRRRQGVDCTVDQVIIFAGPQSPLFFVAKLFIEPGDNVIVEEPGHIGARNTFTACGARILSAPVDDEGISMDAVKEYAREKIKLIYITPKFHDPTGVCLSSARRAQLAELAAEHDILIVEDAWDSDYRYISPDLPALQSMSNNNVFYIYSFWKSLYPLSMVGCLVVPERYIKIFEKAKSLIDGVNPVLEHYTLAEFIAEGHLERHLKTVTRQLTQQRKNLIEDLISAFGTALRVPKQSAAFWLTARLDIKAPAAALLDAAKSAGVKMISTQAFYANKSDSPTHEFLISFTEPDRRIDFSELSDQACRSAR